MAHPDSVKLRIVGDFLEAAAPASAAVGNAISEPNSFHQAQGATVLKNSPDRAGILSRCAFGKTTVIVKTLSILAHRCDDSAHQSYIAAH